MTISCMSWKPSRSHETLAIPRRLRNDAWERHPRTYTPSCFKDTPLAYPGWFLGVEVVHLKPKRTHASSSAPWKTSPDKSHSCFVLDSESELVGLGADPDKWNSIKTHSILSQHFIDQCAPLMTWTSPNKESIPCIWRLLSCDCSVWRCGRWVCIVGLGTAGKIWRKGGANSSFEELRPFKECTSAWTTWENWTCMLSSYVLGGDSQQPQIALNLALLGCWGPGVGPLHHDRAILCNLRHDHAIPCDLRLPSVIPRRWSLAIPRKGFWFLQGRTHCDHSVCERACLQRGRKVCNHRPQNFTISAEIPCDPPFADSDHRRSSVRDSRFTGPMFLRDSRSLSFEYEYVWSRACHLPLSLALFVILCLRCLLKA